MEVTSSPRARTPSTASTPTPFETRLSAWEAVPCTAGFLRQPQQRTQAAQAVRSWISTGNVGAELDLSDMNLGELPPLPDNVQVLKARSNRLTSIDALPADLVALDVRYNDLTQLQSLPHGLAYLNLGANLALTLPQLPDGMQVFVATDLVGAELPATLPSQLRVLDLSRNYFRSYPDNLDALIKTGCCNLNNSFSRFDESGLEAHVYSQAIALEGESGNAFLRISTGAPHQTPNFDRDTFLSDLASTFPTSCAPALTAMTRKVLDFAPAPTALPVMARQDADWHRRLRAGEFTRIDSSTLFFPSHGMTSASESRPDSPRGDELEAGVFTVPDNINFEALMSIMTDDTENLVAQLSARLTRPPQTTSSSAHSSHQNPILFGAVSRWHPELAAEFTKKFGSHDGVADLIEFLGKLEKSKDETRAHFGNFISGFLAQMMVNPEFAEKIFPLAHSATERCADRVTVYVNDIQRELILARLKPSSTDATPQRTMASLKTIFRLEEIRKIAVQHAARVNKSYEEVEFQLAYQTKLDSVLDLDLPGQSHRYGFFTNLTDLDCKTALAAVRKSEASQFHAFLSSHAAWHDVMAKDEKFAPTWEKTREAISDAAMDQSQKLVPLQRAELELKTSLRTLQPGPQAEVIRKKLTADIDEVALMRAHIEIQLADATQQAYEHATREFMDLHQIN